MFRFRLVELLGVVLLALVGACGSSETQRSAAAKAPDVSRDDFGAELPLGRSPQRIVSLNPTTTELLFAIGAGGRLVGRSQYDVFPDAARSVPSLGIALRPNIEAILAVRPDLVVLYASNDNRPAADRLRQAGIPVVAFKIDSIAQFARASLFLGRMTGDSSRAVALVDSVSATLERVRASTAALPHPSVFIQAWEKPIIAIGGGSFLSELLHIAGASNIYDSVPAPSIQVTLEDIVQRNPDFVLASPVSAPAMRASASWRTVPAIRAGRLLVYDTVLVGRPSVLLGAAAQSLAALLHPELRTAGVPR